MDELFALLIFGVFFLSVLYALHGHYMREKERLETEERHIWPKKPFCRFPGDPRLPNAECVRPLLPKSGKLSDDPDLAAAQARWIVYDAQDRAMKEWEAEFRGLDAPAQETKKKYTEIPLSPLYGLVSANDQWLSWQSPYAGKIEMGTRHDMELYTMMTEYEYDKARRNKWRETIDRTELDGVLRRLVKGGVCPTTSKGEVRFESCHNR